jgi:hypothetical protein
MNKYDLTGDYGVGFTSKGERFLFDLEDYNLIKDYTWSNNGEGYMKARVRGTSRFVKMHQLVFGKNPDHRNGDRSDNRRKNLREASLDENNRNKGINRNNTSGIKGVSYMKRLDKWRAEIMFNRKAIYLGIYKDMDLAISVREVAELLLFGEMSRNFSEYSEKYSTTIHQELFNIVKERIESIEQE